VDKENNLAAGNRPDTAKAATLAPGYSLPKRLSRARSPTQKGGGSPMDARRAAASVPLFGELFSYIALGPRIEGRAREEYFLTPVHAHLIYEGLQQEGACHDLILIKDR
jgi:hypothetical protein